MDSGSVDGSSNLPGAIQMKQIAQGAEATIYIDKDKIIKKRIPKSYRLKKLDETLRKFRTRREAKFIEKLPIAGPKLIKVDDKDMIIEMEFIKGDKVRDILDRNIKLSKEIGQKVAILHNKGMIHGDLTTSNMILKDEIYFVDFGLSFFSHKIEDKAVDLHLLRQALESKHYKIFEKAFKLVLEGYKEKAENYKEIMQRFEKVEQRGRYKLK
jgi:TP53 regulating kinase-like protein